MVNISVRLEEEEKEQLLQFAKDHDLTMSQVIRKALRDYMSPESRQENS